MGSWSCVFQQTMHFSFFRYVGLIEVKFNWRKLSSEPARVFIRDVRLVATPKTRFEVSGFPLFVCISLKCPFFLVIKKTTCHIFSQPLGAKREAKN